MECKRVACLYRVSTLAQVEKNDIPTQRKACARFISSKPDWVFTKEYLEKGVSGYKKSAVQRDVLQTIKTEALNKEFDVLLVFMFDRLGRKEDETPFVVQWFDSHGIEVWSVNEGQQKFEGQTDRLINYIRFWQSQGESEKTGIRVREKHTQMIAEGKRPGGVAPYGYKLILNGEVNNKGILLHDLVIDEVEGPVVKRIYDLATTYGMGGHRIAKKLNEENIPAKKGGQWGLAVVNYILRNPIYKGQVSYSKSQYKGQLGRRNPADWLVSDVVNDNWKIIEKSDWDKAQEIRTARTPKMYQAENINYDEYRYPSQTKSKLLLTGMIHCGSCGATLCTGKSSSDWITENDVKHRTTKTVYKCAGKCSGMLCEGKHTYDKDKLETTVLNQVYCYLDQLKEMDLSKVLKLSSLSDLKADKSKMKSLERTSLELENKFSVLKSEVVKSISGESKFTPELLQSLLVDAEREIEDNHVKLKELDKFIKSKEIEMTQALAVQERIPRWRDEFNEAPTEVKKMMLAELIEDIKVNKTEIEIKFKIRANNFAKQFENGKEEKVIMASTLSKLS